jgi:excisionase family DNA binding protein
MFQTRNEQVVEPLLLTTRQAAKALAVCEKTLWSLTKRGEIPAVRIGRAVRYSMDELQAWVRRASEKKSADSQNCA